MKMMIDNDRAKLPNEGYDEEEIEKQILKHASWQKKNEAESCLGSMTMKVAVMRIGTRMQATADMPELVHEHMMMLFSLSLLSKIVMRMIEAVRKMVCHEVVVLVRFLEREEEDRQSEEEEEERPDREEEEQRKREERDTMTMVAEADREDKSTSRNKAGRPWRREEERHNNTDNNTRTEEQTRKEDESLAVEFGREKQGVLGGRRRRKRRRLLWMMMIRIVVLL